MRTLKNATVLVVLALALETSASEPPYRLIKAQIAIESGNNDWAIGDRHLKYKAYGCLQVRQPVCDDVNRRYGTKHKAEECLGNRTLSIDIYKKYLSMWGKNATEEQLARIWNGGPRGADKEATLRYWKKVQKVM